MLAGRMAMHLRLGMALAVGLAGSARAETGPECAALIQTVEALSGLTVSAPPAANDADWCVLDGARITGADALRITVQLLRVSGTVLDGEVKTLEIEAAGLRVAPALNDRSMPGWLRDLLRLQLADVHLIAFRDAATDSLVLQDGRLELSGGGELAVNAEIAGARLSSASMLTGRVTRLALVWKNDGRTLRPVMEALGQALVPERTGSAAVDAARTGLAIVLEAVPEASLPEGDAEALGRFILALPQGRGRLDLNLASESGIGAAELGLLALAKDPSGPDALARFFAGTRISAGWQPGLAP